ncbi:MAG: MMPL family transporter [Thermoleophilia bacterium]|nr:MMPL family transporter [Thermoleophilia bacterium]
MKLNNLAGRVGGWAAANPKDAIFGWIAFVAIAVALGAHFGTKPMPQRESTTGESARADQILSRVGLRPPIEEAVLVQITRLHTPTVELYKAVRDATDKLQSIDDVRKLRSPLDPRNPNLIAWDLRSALITFRVRGNPDQAAKRMEPILTTVAKVQKRHPKVYVAEFGKASSDHALEKSIGKDFKRAEISTVPLTIAILLIAFGAMVAAGLPVLLAFSGVLATLGLAGLASHIFPMAGDAKSVILLVGMAVGIDYSLFYIRREREERARGYSRREALLRTSATSGHTVLISGLTVLIAMSGMFCSGSEIFTSFAVGTMIMVAVAILGSVTVLPAMLSMLGDRVNKGRIRFLHRGRATTGEAPIWTYVLDRVLRRPALSAALAASVLLALSLPALNLHTQFPGFSDLPSSLGFAKTHDRIQTAFGDVQYVGEQTPAVVAVHAKNIKDQRVHDAIAALQRVAVATGQMSEPTNVRIDSRKRVAAVSIQLKGDGNDTASKRALETLRTRVIPATVGKIPGVTADVTGATAATVDFNHTMTRHMPLVFGFALVLVFILLLVTFRSIVVPIKAVVLNLLSVSAAYGVLVLVFQHRWAEGIIGFRSNGAIVSWLPMFLFVILFGISMDYHVFILTRIRELVDGGMDTEAAVAEGIKKSASVVTSAASVMVGVFAIFATLNVLEMKQMGIGLGTAILLDATVIRAVLLPATMKLLGDWNWYFPSWLEWIPRVRTEREPPLASEAPVLDPA